MPSSISINGLSAKTPDGRTLFENLDLDFPPVRTGLIGRNGVGKSTLLRLIALEAAPLAGSIAVNGTIGRLEQIVPTGEGRTVADALRVTPALERLDRLEQGRGSPEDALEADWTLPARMETALGRLGLPAFDPARPLATLSGGQITRVALARLLVDPPDFILLDEPTNNLDAEGRAAVAELVAGWRGGAIVVSHDRALLRQMDRIVELTTLGARIYGGNWDLYAERKAIELSAAEAALDRAERRVAETARDIQAMRERKARRDSAGARQRTRGGAPKILLNGMRSRAQVSEGALSRIAERKRQQAGEELAQARAEVEILTPLSVRLVSTGLPAGRSVLELDGVTGGPDPALPTIRNIDLRITGPERVAITGPNGVGKTTLLRLIAGEMKAAVGNIRRTGRFALLDQQVALLDPALTIRDNFRRLNPEDGENACRAALARFMFRAEAALQRVETLSGGERMRAGLATVIGGEHPVELLILDEPTNHLDLEAIAAVEAGLRAYDGALLVASHDRDFLAAIGITREVALSGGGADIG